MSEDVLSGLLRRIRLRGALFFNVECVGAWVTEAPAAALISSAVMPASEHLMEYHIVLGGTCWAGTFSLQYLDPKPHRSRLQQHCCVAFWDVIAARSTLCFPRFLGSSMPVPASCQ